MDDKEYYRQLLYKLFDKLSKFEKKVLLLYVQRYSYDQIMIIINKNYKYKKSKKRVRIKSIDNALSRIKDKGKDVFDKYQEKNKEEKEEI